MTKYIFVGGYPYKALDGGEKISLMPVSFDEFLTMATQENFRETDVKLKVLEAKLDEEKMHDLKELFVLGDELDNNMHKIELDI